MRAVVVFASLVALAACASPIELDDDGEEGVDEPSPIADECVVGGGAPQTIDELVAHIDALPHPVTIPCVLASLPRPLSLVATTSVLSVQPAKGDENPRLFIIGDGLIFSVVATGDGSDLLEFSEFVSDSRTIKAELEFPIHEAIDPDEPYEHDRFQGLTSCGLCHPNESEWPERPGAFVSSALRPVPSTLVPVDSLEDELDACDWQAEASRCTMLSAVFDYGEVEQGAFPEGLPTIFD